jgi:hypothetical protein
MTKARLADTGRVSHVRSRVFGELNGYGRVSKYGQTKAERSRKQRDPSTERFYVPNAFTLIQYSAPGLTSGEFSARAINGYKDDARSAPSAPSTVTAILIAPKSTDYGHCSFSKDNRRDSHRKVIICVLFLSRRDIDHSTPDQSGITSPRGLAHSSPDIPASSLG